MTVEEAIPLAIERVKTLFAGSDHRLEEIKDDGWEITVSYVGARSGGVVSWKGDR